MVEAKTEYLGGDTSKKAATIEPIMFTFIRLGTRKLNDIWHFEIILEHTQKQQQPMDN